MLVVFDVHFSTLVSENCSSILSSQTFPPESSSQFFDPNSTLEPFTLAHGSWDEFTFVFWEWRISTNRAPTTGSQVGPALCRRYKLLLHHPISGNYIHWLEFDEPYMLLPVSLLLERDESPFNKITQKLSMANPDPNTNPHVPVVWEPACSTVQTVFSYSTVFGD